jgi:hypothetical protein
MDGTNLPRAQGIFSANMNWQQVLQSIGIPYRDALRPQGDHRKYGDDIPKEQG